MKKDGKKVIIIGSDIPDSQKVQKFFNKDPNRDIPFVTPHTGFDKLEKAMALLIIILFLSFLGWRYFV